MTSPKGEYDAGEVVFADERPAATADDDLYLYSHYTATCSLLDQAVGQEGVGWILIATIAIATTIAVATVLRSATKAPDRLDKKVKETRNLLEEITERERKNRLKLEAEVERIREIKRQKAEEIEHLRKIKDEEERKVRERQERATLEANQKKEREIAQQQLEKEALVRAHTEGMLCVLKDAKAQLPDVTLRVPLLDSVDFPTTISHLKVCTATIFALFVVDEQS
jgi:uncharacterized membrane protein YhiD involved in acid resistance